MFAHFMININQYHYQSVEFIKQELVRFIHNLKSKITEMQSSKSESIESIFSKLVQVVERYKSASHRQGIDDFQRVIDATIKKQSVSSMHCVMQYLHSEGEKCRKRIRKRAVNSHAMAVDDNNGDGEESLEIEPEK
jgi:hypothetical protein